MKGQQMHGLSKHPLYKIWKSIKSRCFIKSDKSYHDYGGRGITICDEWRNDFKAFYDWSIENGYEKGLEIGRQENDGNYTPINCRWATRLVQANNKRNNRYEIFNGERKTITQIAREVGLNPSTLKSRINRDGLNIKDALSAPVIKPENACWRGHEFTEHNTYMRPDGKRACRACRKYHIDKLRKKAVLN